jgi:hypothetical protein
MYTNDQTKMTSLMQRTLRHAAVVAAALVVGAGAASAQMTPTQPVLTPATPAAAPTSRSASQQEATFKRIELNGDGFISKAELEKADPKLGQDFQKYDTDGDGKLSMPEFDAMMAAMKG